MKSVLLLLLVLLPGLASAQAPADKPLIRTKVDPAQDIVVGQPVRLDVDVLFPGEMIRPPLVTLPEAAGAQIFRFETQALTIRDRIDGLDYVGQTFEFVLFPRRGGTIEIPAARVTLLDRSGDPIGAARGSPSRIAVGVPPGIDASGPVLASDKVEVSQEWAPDPGQAKLAPGGALVRTIRRQADGVPALGMAEFAFKAPPGVRVYTDPPVIDDRTNRGQVTGSRTDKITYVFEKTGNYDLPALSQSWWSLSDRQAHTETLPGVTVTVAVAASAAASDRPWLESARIAIGLLVLLGCALSVVLVGGRWLARALKLRQEHHRASAAFARHQLLRVARTGDPGGTYQALIDWRKRLSPADLAAMDRDPAMAASSARLGQTLFADIGGWDRAAGVAFARAVTGWRRGGSADAASEPLPPLNPVAGNLTRRPL